MLREGELFAGFRVGGCIHAGSGVQLYRVKHAQGLAEPGFPMVLKLASGSAGQAQTLRLEAEQRLLPVLAGAPVPRFVAAGWEQGQPYLVREYVSGASLAQQPQRLPVEEVVRLGIALGQALHSLHTQQVLHLDLQPEHVLLREDGRVVLLGLGRAYRAGWPDLWHGARPGDDAAPPVWAPELHRGQRTEPRSDVYAIGALLYQLLTGVPPFATGGRRRWPGPVPLQQHRPLLPAWLQELVLRCLAFDAAARPASVAQLVFELQHPPPKRLGPQGPGRPQLQQRAAAVWSRLRGRVPAPPSGAGAVVLAVLPAGEMDAALQQAARDVVAQWLGAAAGARLLGVTVLAPPAPGEDESLPLRLQQQRLHQWAQPLAQQGQVLAVQVRVAADAVQTVRELARQHLASHVVLALPAEGDAAPWQALLDAGGCPVTVVRAPRPAHSYG